VYRTTDDYKIKVALACQTVIEEGMYLTQIPFFPANKSVYNIEKMSPSIESLTSAYPEFLRCVSCNTCGKICPQDLEVMEYMNAAMRGDLEKVAKLSFECIMCGLCTARCPAELVQYNLAVLCRRLYAKYLVPKSEELENRVEEIHAGKYNNEYKKIESLNVDDLREKYNSRDIESE
jgi:formate hydrogenlyase subunit 6/NADH:ubiquinone oxidoreductase subunit I